jgi:hypothetical protein
MATPFIVIVVVIMIVCIALAVFIIYFMQSGPQDVAPPTQTDQPPVPLTNPTAWHNTGELPPFIPMPMPIPTQPLSEIYNYDSQPSIPIPPTTQQQNQPLS